MKRLALAAATAAIVLTGCSQGTVTEVDGPAVNATKTGHSDGAINVFKVNVDGKSVTCIESYSWTTDGRGVGLSCDFGGTP